MTATELAVPATATQLAGALTAADETSRQAVFDAEAMCAGLGLADIVLEGCPGTRCEDADAHARCLSLTDLERGTTLHAGRIALAHDRLRRLGWFRSIGVRCLPDLRGRARLTFTVVGQTFVRKVELRGNEAVYADELQSKLVIWPGTPFEPGSAEANDLLQRQREAIVAQYQRFGFDTAAVTMATEPIAPGEIRVVIEIKEGQRQRVNELAVRIQALPPSSESEEAAGLVCPVVRDGDLRKVSGLEHAEVYSRRLGNKAKVAVRRLLRRAGYGDPRIEVTVAPGERVIRLDVRLGPCAQVQILVREEGAPDARAGFVADNDPRLLDVLPSTESGVFDFDEADSGRRALERALENRGYPFVRVALEHRPVPKLLASQVAVTVRYFVTTGYLAQVRGISFPGVARFSAGELAGVLSSRAYDVLDSGGYMQPEALEVDLDALAQHYRSHGYYAFRFGIGLPDDATPLANPRTRIETADGSTVFEYRWPGKGFRVRRPPDEHFLYVEVPVIEGEPSQLRRLRFEGVRAIPETEVRSRLQLDGGDIVSKALLDDGLRRIEELYRNDGFFRATVVATCATLEPTRTEGPCSREQLVARTVDLRVHIEEGDRVLFGEAFAAGNFGTRADVLLRDFPDAGRAYSAEALFDAQRGIRNLGLFSQVSLRHIGDEETPARERLATVVNVVEAPARWYEASAGFQTINARRIESQSLRSLMRAVDGVLAESDRLANGLGERIDLDLPNLLLAGEFAYVNLNWLRRGWELRLPLKLGLTFFETKVKDLSEQRFDDDCSFDPEPWNCRWHAGYERFLRVASFVPTYVNRRLFDSQWGVRISPYVMHDYAISAVDVDQSGVLTEVTRRFEKVAFSVGGDVGGIRVRDATQPGALFSDFGSKFRLEPTVVYDATDSPINPRKGGLLTLRGPTYINALIRRQDGESYEHANFLKAELAAKLYLPIGPATLALHARAGGAVPLGGKAESALPENERFRLGGDNDLRGFVTGGVRQYRAGKVRYVKDTVGLATTGADGVTHSAAADINVAVNDGNAVLNGSMEVRFPILRDLNILGAAFWDWGGLADDMRDFRLGAFRHSVGLGLRYVFSGQIPIRLDYALAIGKRCRELKATPYVDPASGNAPACETFDDSGAASFALLYSF